MAFLDVKTKFVQLSGRFDLVVDVTNYVDTGPVGAHFFLDAGQRLLDGMLENPYTEAELSQTLTIGDNAYDISNSKSIKEVWIFDSEDGWLQLEKRTLEWMRENFNQILADTSNDIPRYWAMDIIRVPVTEGKESVVGLTINPPPDKAYSLRVDGAFKAKVLSGDTDINYWTENYPDILISAALYKLEEFYRNTEGMKDWLLAIERDMTGIDHNLAAQESAKVNQMRG